MTESRARVRTPARVLVCLAASAALSNAVAAQEADAPGTGYLTLEKYLEVEEVREARISPDGSEIVYVREWIDPMTDRRESALWIMGSDGTANRHLTKGDSPRWSPSGDRLAFLGCGTPAADPKVLLECDSGSQQQIYVRIMRGAGAGSVTQISRLTESASAIQWSPDGTRIAFTAFVPEQEGSSLDLPKPADATWTAEPRVIDRLDYRQDRRGFTRSGFDHIFVVPAEGGTADQLSHGDYNHGDPQWSPDGRTLFFDGFRREDIDYTWYAGSYLGRPSKVYALDVATRNIDELTDHLGIDRDPRVSPDGRLIAFVSADSTDHAYVDPQLHVMDADGSNRRLIWGDLDRPIRDLVWASDASGVYFSARSEGASNLYFASLDGDVRQITDGEHDLRVTDFAPGETETAVGILSTPHIPSDVVSFSVDRPEIGRLTRVNDDVLDQVELGAVEDFWYESTDGLPIQGWIVRPPDFDPDGVYPLILSIHGGPHGMYGFGFDFSFQNFAANGYVVLYTNPRGSAGYGSDFGNGIENAYPGKDFDDLMRGVDEVIAQGYVDASNLFVAGCSGGGTLTAWVVGHTDRFAAASARCPISNWISFVGTTDGTSWYRTFDRFPWEDPSDHLARSPLMYVGEATTPTLIMVGENDLRTPVGQAEELYSALKVLRVPTKLILMKDEWHGTTRNPSNFMRTQLFEMDWFEQHMTPEMRGRMVAAARTPGRR